ncbi:HNH endonuclease signature motif containing protein [Mycolicibacterium bacteremicum]|uniref:HNH endonuclease signature motif containing protein n=1 Tax=Mycolicibacterium bacteremicum TaxID=564198 RepID=UPI0021F397FE|nr:HNH endonuclease signature motif containing protein [Mycolicibacterium bacteremicum]MCV7435033.1 DUF222 domain-containing protein [Mycolicibacterium bacteremicum]
MFERSELSAMSDDALIDAVRAETQAEAAAAARRLAVIAEVTSRWCDDEDEFSALKLIDGWAQAKAQISAACNLGPHATNTQMRIAVALRQRLPRTAALFATGAITAKIVAAITWRTHLVTDPDALARIDTGIAEDATAYGTLSTAKIVAAITWRTHLVTDPDALARIDTGIAEDATAYGTLSEAALLTAIDHWVHQHDPLAVIRSKNAAKDRYLEFGDSSDPDGVVSFWGRMRATDAKITETRANELADGVCANDPRTQRERRADAVAAVMAGGTRLTCLCGDPNCDSSGKDPRSAAVTIYVLTGQQPDTSHGAHPATGPEPTGPTPPAPDDTSTAPEENDQPAEGEEHGDQPAAEPDTDTPSQPPAAKTPAPAARNGVAHPNPPTSPIAATLAKSPAPGASDTPGAEAGITLDGAIIPAHLLTELITTGATIRPLSNPADLTTEPRYRPSTKLAAHVRMTAMTCSFPGCGRPAHRCDLDHLTPWPAGATHPGNLRPLCREHHLLPGCGRPAHRCDLDHLTPWPAGATHPGNLRPLCREHHLLKTATTGWTPHANPNGTTTWTTPTGHRYTTAPLAPVLFPHTITETPIPRTRHITVIDEHDRTPTIPTRNRTRQHDREYRINTERARNARELALEHTRG